MIALPHDLIAEKWLAGCLLIGERDGIIAAEHLGEIETVDLYDERMRLIIRAALDLRDAGQSVDCVAVAEELLRTGRISPAWPSPEDCINELLQLMNDAPHLWHIGEWSKRVQDAARHRQALITVKNLVSDLAKPSVDADDVAETVSRLADLVRHQKPKTHVTEISLMNVADVQPKDVSWLWPNRIPAAKLTLLCGDPGLGKSHLTMDIAARVSNGWRWPDDPATSLPGKVIIFSAEDDIADTIRPRLDRAGADVRNVYCLESVKLPDTRTGKNRHAAFSLADHIPLLKDAIEKLGDVRLIIIDPVSSYTGSTDSHKNAEVRTMLTPLVDLAESHGFAILAVTHLSKGAGGKAVYRATGSLAFAAAARAVWMLAKDLDDPSRRLLLPVKCNIAPELSGLAFHIASDMGGSFVAWGADPVAMTADGYLAEENKRQSKGSSDDDSALAQAVEFVREQLRSGPMLSTELTRDAKEHGIKSRTLQRAVDHLEVISRKGDDGRWVKSLPDQECQAPSPQNVGHLGNVGKHQPVDSLNLRT